MNAYVFIQSIWTQETQNEKIPFRILCLSSHLCEVAQQVRSEIELHWIKNAQKQIICALTLFCMNVCCLVASGF